MFPRHIVGWGRAGGGYPLPGEGDPSPFLTPSRLGVFWHRGPLIPPSMAAVHATACVVNTDIDECAANNGGCSDYAYCTNTPGNFTCTCIGGYFGDGFTCSGSISVRRVHVMKCQFACRRTRLIIVDNSRVIRCHTL